MTSVEPMGDGWRLQTPAGLHLVAVPDPELSAWRLTLGAGGQDVLQIGPPPWYQECHPEPVNGRLLLIGQHGRRHYSGVLTCVDAGMSLEFSLRWTSRLSAEDLTLQLTSFSEWWVGDGEVRFAGMNGDGWVVAIEGAERTIVDPADPRRLLIELNSAASSGTLTGRIALLRKG